MGPQDPAPTASPSSMNDAPQTAPPEPHEEWRPVVGYDGAYEVSSLGRVRSRLRPTRQSGVLAQFDHYKGYRMVKLARAGKRTGHYVHRLVAEAFVPNPEGKPEVNHLDTDKTNNTATNLEWATGYENVGHALAEGLTGYPKAGVLGPETAAEIKRRLADGESGRALAREYGVDKKAISRIRHGVTYAYVEPAPPP